jgi:hypothetical protein
VGAQRPGFRDCPRPDPIHPCISTGRVRSGIAGSRGPREAPDNRSSGRVGPEHFRRSARSDRRITPAQRQRNSATTEGLIGSCDAATDQAAPARSRARTTVMARPPRSRGVSVAERRMPARERPHRLHGHPQPASRSGDPQGAPSVCLSRARQSTATKVSTERATLDQPACCAGRRASTTRSCRSVAAAHGVGP